MKRTHRACITPIHGRYALIRAHIFVYLNLSFHELVKFATDPDQRAGSTSHIELVKNWINDQKEVFLQNEDGSEELAISNGSVVMFAEASAEGIVYAAGYAVIQSKVQ